MRPQEGEGSPAAIVRRVPRARAAAEMVRALQAQVSAFEHLGEDARADIVAGLERSLARWSRFLLDGAMPPDEDFDVLRVWARARAAEGLRLEDLLRSFGLFRRLGWQILREQARPDEDHALLTLAELSAEYMEQVSVVVTETYLAERELLVSEEERRTHGLLDRLCQAEPLGAAERELADRLGVPLEVDFSPFEVLIPHSPPRRHAALAARLRQGGWRLAVTQSDRVTGLAWSPLHLADLEEGPDVLLALSQPVPRASLAEARADLALTIEQARTAGASGELAATDWLLETIIARSPRLAAQMRERILSPLDAELGRTLRTLLSCAMDRTAASATLQIHRNTLGYRIGRIQELTGMDLSRPHDLACVEVALQASPAEAS
jgi:hypothetical protein